MGARPAQTELLEALELVREVQSAPDVAAYRERVLGVQRLVPCIQVGYNEVDNETGETLIVIDPPDALPPGGREAFSRHAHQHPVIRHHRESGEHGPHAISDFLTADELHALDLYREVYEPMGAEDQLSFILPSPPGMIVGIAMNRSRRGFSEAERELVSLVRPHLGQAFRDAQMRDSLDPLGDERLRALGLSERESDVIRLLVEGLSAAEVADRLEISVHTANNHVARIYRKLEVGSRGAAVAAVLRATPPEVRG
jgi:DNA-binding CsgD family transcriptional regulator